jgi:Transcription factor TFIID complex subunit 8 C-term
LVCSLSLFVIPKQGVGRVPSFPIESGVNLPSVLEIKEDMPVQATPDIPNWLPPLPEKHTYIRTEMEDDRMAPKEAQGIRLE